MRLVFGLILILCGSYSVSQGVIDDFDKKLEQLVEEYNYPGAIAAYRFSNGEMGIAAAGLADVERNISMSQDHRILAGSVGKTFVSAIVLMLENEGKLSYDDRISKWFKNEPWFENLPNHDDIRITHLLSHQAGLLDHVQTMEFATAIQARLADPDMPGDFVFTPVEMIQFILDKEPLFKAGEGYSYTDTGYILLGLIIEKITGRTYYDLLTERILRPHGLDLTSPSDQMDLDMLASGYTGAENPMGLPAKISEGGKMAFNPGTEWTGGGLISSPIDLVRWASILYQGQLMEENYLDQLIGEDQIGSESYYGYGVQVRKSELGTTYGHGGWFPGYRTQMVYFVDLGLAIAVQINTDQGVNMGRTVRGLLEVILD